MHTGPQPTSFSPLHDGAREGDIVGNAGAAVVGAKLGTGEGSVVGTVVVGAALGDQVGTGEGGALGVDEGAPIGSVDGNAVGVAVKGAAVGAVDGVALGVEGLGTSVGSLKLGVLVGSEVVRAPVGSTVGGQSVVPHSWGHIRATTETTVLRSPSGAQSATEKEWQNTASVTTCAQLSALGADVGAGSVGTCVGWDEVGAPDGSEVVGRWVGSDVIGARVGSGVGTRVGTDEAGAPVGSEAVGNWVGGVVVGGCVGSGVLGWSVGIGVGWEEVGDVRETQSPHSAGHTDRSWDSAHMATLRQNPRSSPTHHTCPGCRPRPTVGAGVVEGVVVGAGGNGAAVKAAVVGSCVDDGESAQRPQSRGHVTARPSVAQNAVRSAAALAQEAPSGDTHTSVGVGEVGCEVGAPVVGSLVVGAVVEWRLPKTPSTHIPHVRGHVSLIEGGAEQMPTVPQYGPSG